MTRETLHVGIDVALQKNAVSFVDGQGNVLGTMKSVPNTAAGAELIEKEIRRLANEHSFQQVRVGTEATSYYDIHLLEHLLKDGSGDGVPLSAYRINPRLIKNFKKSFTEGSKTDQIDSYFVAQYVRFRALLPEYRKESGYQALRHLTRFRHSVVKNITAETSRFTSSLFLHIPGIVQQKPIDPAGNTIFKLAGEYLTPDQIAQMPLDELAALLAKYARNGFDDPKAKALDLKNAAEQSFEISDTLDEVLTFIEAAIADNIKTSRRCLKIIDGEIAKRMKQIPNTLQSVKGIGPVYAAGIAAEIGDITKYASDSQIAKKAGLVWNKHQSADKSRADTPMSHHGNKVLRYYLVEAANSLRVHNEQYCRYYQKKYNEVKEHNHRRALVLTARKLVRLVYSLLKTNQIYNPAVAAQQP